MGAMRKALVIAALCAAACAQQPAQPPAMDDAASLAAAESAFAAHSVREDMRAAFLAHFADDGMFVRNGWANSNAFLANQPAPPIVLDWRPVHSEAGAPWKVAVDLGIGHPKPLLWDQPLGTSAPTGASASVSHDIESAELDFVSDAHVEGLRSAYAKHGSGRMRFYRTGFAPAVGRIESLASPAMSDEKFAWVVDRTEISRSRDFGYARGSFAALTAPAKPLGYFLRVWRMERGGWRIVMDVTNPAAKL
jgi:hypothetical protein